MSFDHSAKKRLGNQVSSKHSIRRSIRNGSLRAKMANDIFSITLTSHQPYARPVVSVSNCAWFGTSIRS